MQQELDALGLQMEVRIHGINETGHHGSNASACQGKDIPWLQEVPEEPVWTSWKVNYRDVVILDGDNEPVGVFNLTEHDLATGSDYEALKTMLIGFAGGK